MNSKYFVEPNTFKILFGGIAIQCLICGLISYNQNDIKQKYCSHCHIFHEVNDD